MEIVSRKYAIENRLPRYFTGKPCKWGHIAERYTLGSCIECDVQIRKRSYKKNKKNYEERHAINARRNYHKYADSRREYYQKNKDMCSARSRKYHKENRALVNAYQSYVRASKRSLTPPPHLQDRPAIAKLFKSARELGELTGRKFHVDHIWPLAKGGVHHPVNHQILEAITNHRKHAAYDGVSGVSYDEFMLAVSAYA